LVVTPGEKFVDFVCPGPVALGGGLEAGFGPASVAVEDEADVAGMVFPIDLAFEPACRAGRSGRVRGSDFDETQDYRSPIPKHL